MSVRYDLAHDLAGPITPLILAEFGADVVKVEPSTGDVHRTMEPMFAVGQRGKRAVALNLKTPDAPAVLERFFRWSDVVHHNSRVGVAERLGYDEATVRAVNPDVIYSFASVVSYQWGDRGRVDQPCFRPGSVPSRGRASGPAFLGSGSTPRRSSNRWAST